MPYINYYKYIRSADWRRRRASFYEETGVRFCFVCGTDKRLQLHHKTYEHLGCEKNEDLVALCSNCHRVCHALVLRFPELTIYTVAGRLRRAARTTRDWRREVRQI